MGTGKACIQIRKTLFYNDCKTTALPETKVPCFQYGMKRYRISGSTHESVCDINEQPGVPLNRGC